MEASRTMSRGAVTCALLATLLIGGVPIWWGLPSWAGWAHDEILPSRVLEIQKWQPKYPPLHRDLLGLVFRVAAPLAGALPAGDGELRVHTALFLAARLVSLAMAVATVWLVYLGARRLFGRAVSAAAAFVIAGMPPFAFYAKTANLDLPYLFWFALSLVFWLDILRRRRLRDFVLFGCAAALAVCTKDQAYGLYLWTPAPLVAVIVAERSAGKAGLRTVFSALLDRRLWSGLGAALALFLLIHRIPFGSEPFLRHLRVILGPASQGYRIFPGTLGGQLEMAALAMRHLSFTLGVPALAAALWGLLVALRRPRRELHLLSLGGFALSYYAGFIAVVGFHYVRFLLPVALVGVFFAARGVQWLIERSRPAPALRLALVALLLAFGLARSMSLDLLLLRDPRYRVEDWLSDQGAEQVRGLAGRKTLPRGVGPVSLRRMREGECGLLAREAPGLLVASRRWALGRPEEPIVERLLDGELGRQPVLLVKPPRLPLLDFDGILTNIDNAAAEIVVLRSTGQRCFDLHTLSEALLELRSRRAPDLRAEVARAVLDFRIPGRLELAPGVVAFGLSSDRWTRGAAPAALALRGGDPGLQAPRLRIGCDPPPPELPVMLSLDSGGEPLRHLFDQAGSVWLPLPTPGAGEERLVLVWANRGWTRTGAGDRVFGVRLLDFDPGPVSGP